ncbi:MAG: esterase [Planctomycetia bacterium]|nr:esterase [Planctomycetia bacterium]
MPGKWTTIEIAGYPADLFEPERKNPHGFVGIYLHGVHLARLEENATFTELFEKHGLPVVCPRTGRCWWTDRICPDFDRAITPERYVLERVLPFIAERFDSAPPRIGLFGTSMGGQGALRLAFRHPNVFPVAAGISPAIDYHLRIRDGDEILAAMYADEEQARQDTATLHVHPLHWPRHIWFCCDPADHRWHESADRLRMKLFSLGIPHAGDLSTTGGGHGFAYYNKMAPAAMEFLVGRLEQERMRVA